MRASVVRRVGLSAVLPCVLAGAVVVSGMSSPGAAGAATAPHRVKIDAQEVAQTNFPQVHWNIDDGADGYRTMLSGLDALARSTANARLTGPVVNTRGNRVTVTVLDNTRTNTFADVVISSPGHFAPTVHAVVRLSDLYVVRVYAVGTSHNRVLNLIRNVPNESGTDDNFFVGREGYDALSRVANQSLTGVTIGPAPSRRPCSTWPTRTRPGSTRPAVCSPSSSASRRRPASVPWPTASRPPSTAGTRSPTAPSRSP